MHRSLPRDVLVIVIENLEDDFQKRYDNMNDKIQKFIRCLNDNTHGDVTYVSCSSCDDNWFVDIGNQRKALCSMSNEYIKYDDPRLDWKFCWTCRNSICNTCSIKGEEIEGTVGRCFRYYCPECNIHR